MSELTPPQPETTMSELKPCKFCSGKPAKAFANIPTEPFQPYYRVICTFCNLSTPGQATETGARLEWNRLMSKPLTPERVDALWDQMVKEHPIQLHGFRFYEAIKQELEGSNNG